MTISSVDNLVAALPGVRRRFGKASFTPQAAGAYFGLWNTGALPAAGGVPSSGVTGDIPTSASTGAIPFPNAATGAVSYLARFEAMANQPGALILFDRIWANSALSPTSLAAQAVASDTLDRPDALGADVEAWLEVNTALGAGATAPSINYTDQDGNAGNSAALMGFVATAAGGRNFPFGLAAGDSGIRSIQTYTNAATLTSGTFSLVMRRRIAEIPIAAANLAAVLDFFALGGPVIDDNAALELVWFAQASASTQVYGSIAIAQG